MTRVRSLLALLLVAAATGGVGLAAASPALLPACPPCGDSFVAATQEHGVATEVVHSEATVRVHRNGSATWTVRNRLANDSAAADLRANRTLARAVARDSFGLRYGEGIDHDLLGVRVEGETFVLRYRTAEVVAPRVGHSLVLTYFRDEPGAYVYTGLGADRLTVIGPPGTVVARGFGCDVGARRTTATSLPGVRNGPFVVFAPADHPFPGALGTAAVLATLAPVILRNVALFVVVPGAVFAGGLVPMRRLARWRDPRPGPAGALVVAVGVGVLAVGAWVAGGTSPQFALSALLAGVLVACGSIGLLGRLHAGTTLARLAGVSLGGWAALAAVVAGSTPSGMVARGVLLALPLLALLPLGYVDRVADARTRRLADGGVLAALLVGLAVTTPLTALGGALFLLVPILLTGAVAVGVVLAAPLYGLGGALAAGRGDS